MEAIVLAAAIAAALVLALFLGRVGIGPGPALALAAIGGAAAARALAGDGAAPSLLAGVFPEASACLLVPVLYRAGLLLGARAREDGPAGEVLLAAARAAAGIFFLGGMAYLLLARDEALTREARQRAAFLIGAALLIPASSAGSGSSDPASALERRRLHLALWGALLGLLAFSALLAAPSGPSGLLSAGILARVLLRILGTAGAGAVAGLLGCLLLRWLRGIAGRVPLHLAIALLAVLAAWSIGGDPLPAAMIAGALVAAASPAGAGPADAGPATTGPMAGPRRDSLEGTWDALELAGGIALFAGAGLLSPQLLEARTLPGAGLLWGWGLLIGALILFVRGGPRQAGAGPLPYSSRAVLAWSLHPGLAAAGIFIAAGLLPAGRSAAPGGGPGSELAGFFLQVILLGLLFQGGTCGPLLRRWGRAPARARERWEEIEGRRLALLSGLEALERMEERGLVPEAAAAAFRRSLADDLRGLEIDRQELLAGSPAIERDRWTAALRAVLDEACRAVERGRQEGRISLDTAERLKREIAGKWERAGELTFREALDTRIREPRPGGGRGGEPRGG